MNDAFAPAAINSNGSIINEHGFTAILGEGDVEGRSAGIIGAPRINPTRAGLRIEDCCAAALDAVIIAILQNFARHENQQDRVDLICRGAPARIE